MGGRARRRAALGALLLFLGLVATVRERQIRESERALSLR